ncbi:MAG: type II toxin-antitoxin system VapC family toxin [Dehalococcoidia bacterium]
MANPDDEAILDASIAAKWYLNDEEFVDECQLLLDRYVDGSLRLIAPLHILYEVPNAILVASRRQPPRLPRDQALTAIREFISLAIPTVHDEALVWAATVLAEQTGCALYDGLYLALSNRLSLPLITADTKLYQLVGHLPNVVTITDYLNA